MSALTTTPSRSGSRLRSLLGAALLAVAVVAGPLATDADAADAAVCEPPTCRIVLEPSPRPWPWPWPGPNPCLSCPDELRIDHAITVINPVVLEKSIGIRPGS